MLMYWNMSSLWLLNETMLLCCIQIEIRNIKTSTSTWKMEAAVFAENRYLYSRMIYPGR